ncbi:substrate-binding periplasmic protein [Roseateles sp.]|uniref:substrate-binding periplasmic protein n=1 Tax=Roseateles sp. TaxID=1971397 RepID=UPI0039ECF7D6
MRTLLGALLWAAACLPALAAPCPKTLRIGFGDVPLPPMLLGHGPGFQDPPGWAVQAARDALRRLGCTAELVRLPGRRLLRGLEVGELEFALFFSATAERLRSMRFPVESSGRADASWAPVVGHLALYGLAGSPALKAWDGNTLAAGVRVGVVAGSVQESLARDRHWTVEAASSFETSVLALRARRFELLLSARESLPPTQLSGDDALVELAPLVERQPYFAPASRAVHAEHPGFVAEFWRELCHATRRLSPEARGQDCGRPPR